MTASVASTHRRRYEIHLDYRPFYGDAVSLCPGVRPASGVLKTLLWRWQAFGVAWRPLRRVTEFTSQEWALQEPEDKQPLRKAQAVRRTYCQASIRLEHQGSLPPEGEDLENLGHDTSTVSVFGREQQGSGHLLRFGTCQDLRSRHWFWASIGPWDLARHGNSS
jgi:hypothetical protein